MKRIVLTFGLISGVVMIGMSLAVIPLLRSGDTSKADVIGYSTILLSSLLVFFGIRQYRANAGGQMTFGRGFAVGLLITLIACAVYVPTWQLVYFKLVPDLGEHYEACMIKRAHESGKGPEEIADAERFAHQFREYYDIPIYNAAMTLVEPLPVGLLVTLISAGVLRRKPVS